MRDIVIIGAGTAGLTAALYAARAGKSVTIVEESVYGGQITYSPRVENYPGFSAISGNEFATKLVEQVMGLGVEEARCHVSAIHREGNEFCVTTDGEALHARAVILATGVKPAILGLSREAALVGAGISYCAVCDGAFYRGGRVAIVGGGNAALQEALYLAGIASHVTLIHRRKEFRGEAHLVEKLRACSNVTISTDCVISEILGEDELTSIRVKNTVTGEQQTLSLDGLFVAVGHVADNEQFRTLVELDEHGFVRGSEDCRTSAEGVFVAGDCRTKAVRQLTTAVADGAVAATNACKYLSVKFY